MKDLETKLQGCLEGIHRHTAQALRGIIGAGLHLTKAAVIFNRQGKRTDLIPTVGISSGEEGFLQWVAENITGPFGFSKATVYNYMNAARNCGLTADSTDEDVAQLDLTGKKAKELYSSPTADPEKKQLPPASDDEKAEQLWLPLWVEMDRYAEPEGNEAKALWKLPVVSADPAQPSLEELERKLKATLDLIVEVKSQRSKPRR